MSTDTMQSSLIKRPSFSRCLGFLKDVRKMSITRALQYEFIKQNPMNGSVLDVGGGEKADYRSWLNCDSYDSVNIDDSAMPTWVVGVGESIPSTSHCYDTIISFNTLEHIFDTRFVLKEMYRVLKDDGKIVLTTPFLFPIHGHPDDFFRPTPSWYKQMLSEIGFKNIEVVPLAWGPFTTGQICSGLPGPIRGLRKQLALVIDFIYMRIRESRSPFETEDHMRRFATAFFVQAKK